MPYQNISASIVQADVDAVKAAIATINAKLPFLIALTTDERKTLVKLGPKSADFVLEASTTVGNFPNILPPSFDKTEFAKDTALFRTLNEIKVPLDSLVEKLDNTYMAVGSEAMTAALEVYAYVQTAKTRTPGLNASADRLQERFKSQGKKRVVEHPTV